MDITLSIGIILFLGFFLGELASRFHLPRVTGYICAGVLLNPGVFSVMPPDIVQNGQSIIDVALAVIVFLIGGELSYHKLKKLEKQIVYVAVIAAVFTLAIVAAGLYVTAPYLSIQPGDSAILLAFCLLMGALAAPTDPSAILAVEEEYKAKGKLSSLIMGITAFDDAVGLLFFGLALSFSSALALHTSPDVAGALFASGYAIIGAVMLGVTFGALVDGATRYIRKESEGVLIIIILSVLFICFGVSAHLKVDPLFATMTLGAVVVNTNPMRVKLFGLISNYTEELIFLVFFTVSAMSLDISAFSSSALVIVAYIAFRTLGKLTGTLVGAHLSGVPRKIEHYLPVAMIPQGGVIVGLAFLITRMPEFDQVSHVILGAVIGATIIHELSGPILAKFALQRVGDIKE